MNQEQRFNSLIWKLGRLEYHVDKSRFGPRRGLRSALDSTSRQLIVIQDEVLEIAKDHARTEIEVLFAQMADRLADESSDA